MLIYSVYVETLNDSTVTNVTVLEDMRHHAPYFFLEHGTFLIVSHLNQRPNSHRTDRNLYLITPENF